jgi:hypothetical protein
MVKFTTTILRFGKQGEKTGWTYILVPADVADEIKPGYKRIYRVKGKLDKFKISSVAIMPMGDGSFCMPLNVNMRKGIGKRLGASVEVQLSEDNTPYEFNTEFMECLADEPRAQEFFQTLTPSHQRYFSKWIDDAKTLQTRTKRIAQAVDGLAKKLGYGEMVRSRKEAL